MSASRPCENCGFPTHGRVQRECGHEVPVCLACWQPKPRDCRKCAPGPTMATVTGPRDDLGREVTP